MAKFAANNPERVRTSHNNSLNKAYCKICDLACGKKNNLAAHEKTKSHLRKAAARQWSFVLD